MIGPNFFMVFACNEKDESSSSFFMYNRETDASETE